MKFREHRGGLSESMASTVELPGRAALVRQLQAIMQPFGKEIDDASVIVEKYGPPIDERIGWDTHIVTVKGLGVMGFTDGPAEEGT